MDIWINPIIFYNHKTDWIGRNRYKVLYEKQFLKDISRMSKSLFQKTYFGKYSVLWKFYFENLLKSAFHTFQKSLTIEIPFQNNYLKILKEIVPKFFQKYN